MQCMEVCISAMLRIQVPARVIQGDCSDATGRETVLLLLNEQIRTVPTNLCA